MAQTFARRTPADLPAFSSNGAPPIRRQRKWSLALVAILVTVGSALAFAVLWMNAGERKPFLAVAQEVRAGQVIEADDLTVVRAAVDGALDLLPAADRDTVIGQSAQTDLVPGTLLTAGHLGEGSFLEDGEAVVGVLLAEGLLPPGLRVGDSIRAVRTRGSSQERDLEIPLSRVIYDARIYDLGVPDPTTGEVMVSLILQEDAAVDIAGAAASGVISLIHVPSPDDP